MADTTGKQGRDTSSSYEDPWERQATALAERTRGLDEENIIRECRQLVLDGFDRRAFQLRK